MIVSSWKFECNRYWDFLQRNIRTRVSHPATQPFALDFEKFLVEFHCRYENWPSVSSWPFILCTLIFKTSFILYDSRFVKLRNKGNILCIQDSDSKISDSTKVDIKGILKYTKSQKMKTKISDFDCIWILHLTGKTESQP